MEIVLLLDHLQAIYFTYTSVSIFFLHVLTAWQHLVQNLPTLLSFRRVLVPSAGQIYPALQWKNSLLLSPAKLLDVVSMIDRLMGATHNNKPSNNDKQYIQHNMEYVPHFFNQCRNWQQKNKPNGSFIALCYFCQVRMYCWANVLIKGCNLHTRYFFTSSCWIACWLNICIYVPKETKILMNNWIARN